MPKMARGRGRPPGMKNGEGEYPLAPIKKWGFKHEQVVGLHLAGWKHDDIGKKVGYTKTRVMQVLNDSQAKEIIRVAKLHLRKRMGEDIEDRLVLLSETSVGRLEETMDTTFIPGTKPKMHQDGLALGLLKGAGYMGKDDTSSEDPEGKITPKLAQALVTALDKSNEAERVQKEENEIVARIGEFEEVS